MKEIEVLVEVHEDIKKMKKLLSKFEYVGTKTVIDEYYYDPKRDDLKPDANNKLFNCLRLRAKDKEYMITYKDDVYENGTWIYSNEYETKIDSITVGRKILKKLGLVKFIEIYNEKDTYICDQYEIVLENVKDLGLFMEVEFCTEEDVDVKKIKRKIQKFIDDLGIRTSKELNMGKPEMYLKLHDIHID